MVTAEHQQQPPPPPPLETARFKTHENATSKINVTYPLHQAHRHHRRRRLSHTERRFFPPPPLLSPPPPPPPLIDVDDDTEDEYDDIEDDEDKTDTKTSTKGKEEEEEHDHGNKAKWKIVDTLPFPQLGWNVYLWNPSYSMAFRKRVSAWQPTIILGTAATTSASATVVKRKHQRQSQQVAAATDAKSSSAISVTTSTTTTATTDLQHHHHRRASLLLVIMSWLRVLQFMLPWIHFLRHMVQVLVEDWNFKGFGWTFYKSVLKRDSCGVALRIPLSLNFATWDRHAMVWPSFSGSIGVYYPWMTSCTVTCSIHVQLLRTILSVVVVQLQRGAMLVVTTLLRTVAICTTTLFFPLLLRLSPDVPSSWKSFLFLSEQATTIATPSISSTTSSSSSSSSSGSVGGADRGAVVAATSPARSSSRTSEQRIGFSWSCSLEKGYEFRISYMHQFLQTILYVLEQVLASQQFTNLWKNWFFYQPPTKQASKQGTTTTLFRSFCDYLRRRTAALGLATSYPIYDFSKCSCAAILSLSGFRLIRPRKQLQQQPVHSPTTTSTVSSAADGAATAASTVTGAVNTRTIATNGGDYNDVNADDDDDEEEELESPLLTAQDPSTLQIATTGGGDGAHEMIELPKSNTESTPAALTNHRRRRVI